MALRAAFERRGLKHVGRARGPVESCSAKPAVPYGAKPAVPYGAKPAVPSRAKPRSLTVNLLK
eukprot:10028479-Lingulodinium_polyedra.AAC.1